MAPVTRWWAVKLAVLVTFFAIDARVVVVEDLTGHGMIEAGHVPTNVAGIAITILARVRGRGVACPTALIGMISRQRPTRLLVAERGRRHAAGLKMAPAAGLGLVTIHARLVMLLERSHLLHVLLVIPVATIAVVLPVAFRTA